MKLTRRDALALSAGAAVFAIVGGRVGSAWAGVEDSEKAVNSITACSVAYTQDQAETTSPLTMATTAANAHRASAARSDSVMT